MINSRRRRRVQWKQGVTPGYIYEFDASRCNGGISPGINSPLTTTAFDTSGHGNHGTLMYFAGTEISGYAGSGTVADPYRLVGDGTSDYVDCGDVGACEDLSFTYEAWTYLSGNDERVIMAEGDSGSTATNVTLRQVGSAFRFRIANDAGTATMVTGAAHTVGGLYHVVGTCDGTTMRLYVDNVEEGVATAPPAGPVSVDRLYLLTRRYNGAFAYYGIGGLPVARAYGRGLTPAEIAQNYAAGPQ